MDKKKEFQEKKNERVLKTYFQIDDDKPFSKLFADVCLVKDVPIDQVETHFSSLVIPQGLTASKNYGLIVQVGNTCAQEPEAYAQVGDIVMMHPGCGHEMELGKNKFRIVRHKDFFGVIDRSNEVKV